MNEKHTPGPWALEDGYIRDPDGKCVLDVEDANISTGDALLMAAAPDLLEALKSMCEGFSALKDSDFPALAKARAAIAKATGGVE